MQLKHRVHFVSPQKEIWSELRGEGVAEIEGERLSELSGGILHSWVLRTYYQLKLAGARVTLSSHLCNDAINIVSVRDFGRRQYRSDCYLLVPQGDAHQSMLADFRVHQNGLTEGREGNATIWHWPQPDIIPRSEARKNNVETLCYKGRLTNLHETFRDDDFKQALSRAGVSFSIDALNTLRGAHSWNNYEQYDAVLAVRNMTEYDARKKPASKLINAWFADCPAILGPEPAYQELRQNEHDYLEVHSPNEALDAVEFLKSNPEFYAAMIKNGRVRRRAFSNEKLTEMWINVLNGPVAEHFEAWNKQSRWRHKGQVWVKFLKEPISKKKDKRLLQSGARLLDTK